MNARTFQRRACPMDFPFLASAVHSKSGEEGSPDQQLCRIPLWPQATSSQLGPVRRDSDQGGHRTFPSVRNQAEPDGHKTFRSWDPFGGCRQGGPLEAWPEALLALSVFPDPSGWLLCAAMAKGRCPQCTVNSTLEGGTRSCLR